MWDSKDQLKNFVGNFEIFDDPKINMMKAQNLVSEIYEKRFFFQKFMFKSLTFY